MRALAHNALTLLSINAAQRPACLLAIRNRALERKAALYERLQREGGGEDAARGDMDARYNVDFVMKARRAGGSAARVVALVLSLAHARASPQPREGAWAHDRYDGDEPPYDEPPYEAGRPRRTPGCSGPGSPSGGPSG